MADEDDVDIMPLAELIMVLLLVGPGACDHDTTRAFNFNAGFSKRRARSVLCFRAALFLLFPFSLIFSLWVFNGFPDQSAGSCGFGAYANVGEDGNDSLTVEICL